MLTHLHFLPPETRPQTERQKNLNKSSAKSHVARVNHARRIALKSAKDAERRPNKFVHKPSYQIHPGFGNYRCELFDLCYSAPCYADARALDFLMHVQLPGIDVANEMFDNSGLFSLFLPNLVSSFVCPLQYKWWSSIIIFLVAVLIGEITHLHDFQRSQIAYPALVAEAHLLYTAYNEGYPTARRLMLEYRGRAMKEIRNKIGTYAVFETEALVVGISILSTIEAALGNDKSYKLHLSALNLLSEKNGHLKTSSGHRIRDIVALYSDTTLALSTGRSAFKRRSFKPTLSLWPHCKKHEPILEQLPSGFIAVLCEVPMSEDVIHVLARACYLGLHVPCVVLTQSQKALFVRRRQTTKKYLNYLDSVPVLLASDESSYIFEKLLVLALSLFAWCGFSTPRLPQFSVYKVMRQQLHQRLLSFSSASFAQRRCEAWMWLMVIDSWRTADPDLAGMFDGLKVLTEFRARFPEYHSWTAVRNLSRCFFWTGDMENFWSQNWRT